MDKETKANNDKPKSVILYPEQWTALSNLSAQELGWLFEAIFRTIRGERGVNLELDGAVKLAYDFLMNQINLDHEKWERAKAQKAVRDKRYRERKKATPRDASPIQDTSTSTSTSTSNSTNSSVVSEKKEGSIAAKEISDKSANFDAASAWQQNFIKTFNELIVGSNIPPVRRLSAKRMDKLRVIWREFSTKDLAEVVRKAAASDFLNGRGTKHYFQATFDWLMEPENFLRVLEGTYR